MKTAGQILTSARKSRKMELADVARITKIRTPFLEIIEADDYGKLPSGTVARGFIRNYSEFVGLNPEAVLAAFRRDFVENELGQIVPRSLATPVSREAFWTPRTTVIAAIVFAFTLFAGYLTYQYWLLIGPPRLELSQPAENLSTTQDSVIVEGLTDPEAALSVNGQPVVLDGGGRFFFRVTLNPGLNEIKVVATSKSGKASVLTRNVVLR